MSRERRELLIALMFFYFGFIAAAVLFHYGALL